MQRRALELQAGAEQDEPADPLEEDPASMASIQVPSLVAAGERDMPDFRDGAERIAAALPNSRRVLIEGAGHLAPLETPVAFRELLLGFLRLQGVI
jgi:pimeloyl-ACP methyl ester carboxylesterase